MLITALVIRLESHGPVISGRNGSAVRPPVHLPEVSQHAGRRRGRRQAALGRRQRRAGTRIGRFIRKTRIDELPQLINVLRAR